MTVSLDKQTVRKAKILTARRGTSISALLGGAIEALVAIDNAYERANAEAMSILKKAFRLVGVRDVNLTDAGEKRAIARDVLRILWSDGSGVVSPQVLQEFYVTVTGQLHAPVTKKMARSIVGAYSVLCVDVVASARIENTLPTSPQSDRP